MAGAGSSLVGGVLLTCGFWVACGFGDLFGCCLHSRVLGVALLYASFHAFLVVFCAFSSVGRAEDS